jgi:hypothetical protein
MLGLNVDEGNASSHTGINGDHCFVDDGAEVAARETRMPIGSRGQRPKLSGDYTIAIVTHNMQQAARCSQYTAFMYLGEMVEFDETTRVFTSPRDKRTQDYVTGRFG